MGAAELHWPQGLRRTRLREEWFARLAAAQPGQTLKELSERLNVPYASVAFWAKCFGYVYTPRGRGRKSNIDWAGVVWDAKNCDIARALGVSAERVRQVRAAYHIAPAPKQSSGGKAFRAYVDAHRDALENLSIRQMIAQSGVSISTATAYSILRENGVKLRAHAIPWNQLDWRLSDMDLARAWGTHSGYVAKARVRLRKPAAMNRRDPAYDAAIKAQERAAHEIGRGARSIAEDERPASSGEDRAQAEPAGVWREDVAITHSVGTL